jgi:N-acetylneuraminic acid mutarotase
MRKRDETRSDVMAPGLRIVPKFAFVVAVVTGVCTTAPLRAADNLGTWSVAAQMTAARTEIGGVVLNGRIYVAGGQEMGRPDSTLFQVFDPVTATWKDLAAMPKGASHVGLAALDGKIYVAGGFTGRPHNNPIDQFAVYDPAANKWQTLAPLPMALGSVSLAAAQGKIHALGGRLAGEVTVDMHAVYDPDSAKWSTAAPLPGPRDHLGVVVVNGRIHVIGGRSNERPPDTGVQDVYDPSTDKWSRLAGLTVPRSGGAVAYYNGLILYYGGECLNFPNRIAYDQFEAYDPNTDRWSALAKAPATMHAQAGAVAGDTVYFLGGSTSCGSDKPSLAVYAFRLH